ncbi:phage holin family protein [Candidatus Curtissbacteria bacterium]|nr:phage holin family protein [Candidatus Curtissbacteria bacterium]
MKHYLRTFIIAAISFYVAYSIIPTIMLGGDPQDLLIVVGTIFFVSTLIKPIFSLILLPFNLLTFGLLSLIINIVLLFALLTFLPGFNIAPYNFPGADIAGIIIQPANLNLIATIVAIALVLTVTQKILHLIFE